VSVVVNTEGLLSDNDEDRSTLGFAFASSKCGLPIDWLDGLSMRLGDIIESVASGRPSTSVDVRLSVLLIKSIDGSVILVGIKTVWLGRVGVGKLPGIDVGIVNTAIECIDDNDKVVIIDSMIVEVAVSCKTPPSSTCALPMDWLDGLVPRLGDIIDSVVSDTSSTSVDTRLSVLTKSIDGSDILVGIETELLGSVVGRLSGIDMGRVNTAIECIGDNDKVVIIDSMIVEMAVNCKTPPNIDDGGGSKGRTADGSDSDRLGNEVVMIEIGVVCGRIADTLKEDTTNEDPKEGREFN
jgi:hypothetical protein